MNNKRKNKANLVLLIKMIDNNIFKFNKYNNLYFHLHHYSRIRKKHSKTN